MTRVIVHNYLPRKNLTQDAEAGWEVRVTKGEGHKRVHIATHQFKKEADARAYASSYKPSVGYTTTVKQLEASDESEFKVGEKVHLGFGARGGAGFYGTITRIDEREVEIRNPEGKTYKGPVRFLSRA